MQLRTKWAAENNSKCSCKSAVKSFTVSCQELLAIWNQVFKTDMFPNFTTSANGPYTRVKGILFCLEFVEFMHKGKISSYQQQGIARNVEKQIPPVNCS